MRLARISIISLALSLALSSAYGEYYPIFDWSTRGYSYNSSQGKYIVKLRTDAILTAATPGNGFGVEWGGWWTVPDSYYTWGGIYYQMNQNNVPVAAQFFDNVSNIPGFLSQLTSQSWFTNPRLDFCFADSEPPSPVVTNVAYMVSQVRNHSNPAINSAHIGNYANYPGTPDYSQQYPSLTDRGYQDSFYRTSGLDVAMPQAYPYAYHIAHTWSSSWGTNIAPNTRSALFWAPLERVSLAKRSLPGGHLLIPYVCGFVPWSGYSAPVPTKQDLRAIIQHYRLRNVDGYYTLVYVCYTNPNDRPIYYATDPNDPLRYVSDEAYCVDMLAAWQSLDTYFNQSGTLTYLNLQTDKISGVQWSGMQKGNQVIILISNLGNSSATVTYPAIVGLPASSPSVAPGTHTLFTYTVNVQTTVQGKITLGDFAGDPRTVPVTIEVRKPNFTVATETKQVTLDAAGNYSFTTMLGGTYDLVAKTVPHWLKARQYGYAFCGAPVTGNFTLVNGDVDGTNAVDATDLSRVLVGLDKKLNDSGYDPQTDLDGDNATTSTDLAIVLANQDAAGIR